MNITDNKRVFALSGIFALAFAGVMYYGYDSMSAASDAEAKLAEMGETVEAYNSAEFAPTKANIKNLKDASKEIKATNLVWLKELEELKKASKLGSVSAVAFQKQVGTAIANLQKKAKENNVTLGNAAKDLGHLTYVTQTAVESEVYYRSYLLHAVEDATHILLDAGVPEIAMIYCADLPQDEDEHKVMSLEDAPAQLMLGFELSFSVKRGQLPVIMNRLIGLDKSAAKNKYFYTITGISAISDKEPPSLDTYSKPTELVPMAGEEASSLAEPQARTLAKLKLGGPEEVVRVHLNLQVLFFNPSSTN